MTGISRHFLDFSFFDSSLVPVKQPTTHCDIHQHCSRGEKQQRDDTLLRRVTEILQERENNPAVAITAHSPLVEPNPQCRSPHGCRQRGKYHCRNENHRAPRPPRSGHFHQLGRCVLDDTHAAGALTLDRKSPKAQPECSGNARSQRNNTSLSRNHRELVSRHKALSRSSSWKLFQKYRRFPSRPTSTSSYALIPSAPKRREMPHL